MTKVKLRVVNKLFIEWMYQNDEELLDLAMSVKNSLLEGKPYNTSPNLVLTLEGFIPKNLIYREDVSRVRLDKNGTVSEDHHWFELVDEKGRPLIERRIV